MANDKKKLTDAIKCAHCDNIAPMQLVGEYSDISTDVDVDEEGEVIDHWEEGYEYQLLVCQVCRKVVLQRSYYHSGYPPEELQAPSTLHPKPDTLINVLPLIVRREYEAARAVRPKSANAYAVLLGRVFDKVCEDRNATGKTLHDKLADLAKKGELPQPLVDMAHSIRQLRNVGAHADLGELNKQEINLLEALLKAILEYLYRGPKLIEAAKKLLSKRSPPTSEI